MRKLLFTLAVTVIGRILILRDRLFAHIPRAKSDEVSATRSSRHSISCGGNVLEAVFVQPAAGPMQAAILLCHGIGETVEHWLPVQQLLAAGGVASLVFDYSGYGRSTGFIDAHQCERDALFAFRLLEALAPSVPRSILGFSLGSGIAVAIIGKVTAHRLFLCAAFTSFREAAIGIGFPRFLGFLVAPLWNAKATLHSCTTPIVIIHGEEDELFPVETALKLASLCGSRCELVLVPELTHNQPFYDPQPAYWNLILSRLTG